MAVLFFLLLQLAIHRAIEVTGNGNPTILAVFDALLNAYNSRIGEEVTFKFTITTANLAVTHVINKTAYYDYGMIDSAVVKPDDHARNPNYKTFPIVALTVVPQFNLKEVCRTTISLSREALAGIFMGDITNWKDERIVATNPDLNQTYCPNNFTGIGCPPFPPCLPNATIKVIYRNDSQPLNVLWGSIMNSFSSGLWAERFGAPAMGWPIPLRNKTNFYGVQGSLMPNAQGLVDRNSISYSGFGFVIRDPQIQYASIVNKYGRDIVPDAQSVTRTCTFMQLKDDLKTSYVIDPPDELAFPWVSFLQVMVTTEPDPARCKQTRAFHKFIRWVLKDKQAHTIIAMGGMAPLPESFGEKILEALSTIKCGTTADSAVSVLAVTPIQQRDVSHVFLLVMNTLILVIVLALTITHLYYFQTSRINLVYSLIFVLGALITLTAPYAWYVVPTADNVCLARVWLTSVGLSVLLGTMFSRTWQLRDIYLLQKKQLQEIQKNSTVRNSLIKLSITLSVVVVINLALLIVWTASDPYRAVFEDVDTMNLTGRWTCHSTNLATWLLLQCAFLLCTITFGVYVIYYTWSFQKRALIEETRWVLMALYNIVLNLTAAVPVVSISPLTEDSLAILVIVSLLFSGGGIIFAFLLPRTLKAIFGDRDDSSHDHDSRGRSHQTKGSHHEGSSQRKETVSVDYAQGSPKKIADHIPSILEQDEKEKELIADVELSPFKSLSSVESSVAKDDPVSQQNPSDDLTVSTHPLLHQSVAGVIGPSSSSLAKDNSPEGQQIQNSSSGGWRVYFPTGSEKDFSGAMKWSQSSPTSDALKTS